VVFGVARTENSFLSGWIIDGTTTGKALSQCLVEAANLCSTVGNAERLVAVVSVDKFIEFSAAQEDKQYTMITGRGGTGYKALLVYADGIELPVISDKYCPNSEAYVMDPKALDHPSMGQGPHMDDEDSSSAGLVDDQGAGGVHAIEIEVPGPHTGDEVRELIIRSAESLGMAVEFVDEC
jgi:hypothetical protein